MRYDSIRYSDFTCSEVKKTEGLPLETEQKVNKKITENKPMSMIRAWSSPVKE